MRFAAAVKLPHLATASNARSEMSWIQRLSIRALFIASPPRGVMATEMATAQGEA